MRILVDENIPQGDIAFAPYGRVERFPGRSLKREDILRGEPCQALIVRSVTRVNAGLLDETPVRFVGTATIGTDHVDRAWLSERDIGFASAPGCNANSVAEYVVAALLTLMVEKGLSLEKAVLGIVGYGHVGRQVRRKAEALGLTVLLCDPPLQEQGGEEDFCDLAEILRQCHIVTLHTPLTKTGSHPTLGLFNRESLREISRPITLINTCRGEVTEADALIEGKKSGKIRHLVLDVFPGEPSPEPELWRICDLITPHIAGYSLQGKLGGTQQVLAAFCRFFHFSPPATLSEPLPSQPVIGLDGAAGHPSPWAAIHTAVGHAYPIQSDDLALRNALGDSEPGKQFDKLRRDYPIRHEFTRYRVTGSQGRQDGSQAILRRLGFEII